jgi:site-specific recombinase XerD
VRACKAENLSKNTIEVYGSAIERLREFLIERGMPTEVTSITREHVEAFMEHLLETRSPRQPRTGTAH